jgi:hypothetical protein
MFNSLCNKLDWWYIYVEENKGDKKDMLVSLNHDKDFYVFFSTKEQSIETIDQGQEK